MTGIGVKPVVALGLVGALHGGIAMAGATTLTFDSAADLVGWRADRFEPAAFEVVADPTGSSALTGGSVLHHAIDAADLQASAFRNTQGMKVDTPGMGIGSSWSVDLYIPSAWESANQRIASIWATTVDSTGAVSGYPIIEFASDGTEGFFQFWTQDTDQNTSNGYTPGWLSSALPSGFAYDAWYTLEVTLNADDYSAMTVRSTDVLETVVFSMTDKVTDGSVAVDNIILQGYNAGSSYDIYWDNLTLNAVPTPASFGAGLLGLAVVAMRRR